MDECYESVSEEIFSWDAKKIKHSGVSGIEIKDERKLYLVMVKSNEKRQEFLDKFQIEFKNNKVWKLLSEELEYCVEGKIQTINTDGTILIGRHYMNHIVLPKKNRYISRVQCIVLNVLHVPTNKKLFIIIDMWSNRGTAVSTFTSFPGKRNIIRVPHGPITLTLGKNPAHSVDIHLCVRTCIICMDALRTHRLPCGHCITCEGCTNQLLLNNPICSICRAPIYEHLLKHVHNQQEAITVEVDNYDEQVNNLNNELDARQQEKKID